MSTTDAPDRILVADAIETMGPAGRVEAIAVRDGRISDVGDRVDVLARRTRATEVMPPFMISANQSTSTFTAAGSAACAVAVESNTMEKKNGVIGIRLKSFMVFSMLQLTG